MCGAGSELASDGGPRWWRVENETHDLGDGWEAVRNHLAGRDFDAAAGTAGACFQALERFNDSAGRAALAAEVLAELPVDHSGYAATADQEGQALLVLGYTNRAVDRYRKLVQLHEKRAAAEPDRADYQRDLVVSLVRIAGFAQDPRAILDHARGILEALHREGRLAPTDRQLIDAVNALLAQVGKDED